MCDILSLHLDKQIVACHQLLDHDQLYIYL